MDYELSKFDRKLFDIYQSAVNSVQPYKLVKKRVKLERECLTVCGMNYEVKKPISIVGFGSVTIGMAIALQETLGDLLQGGMISIPKGSLSCSQDIPVKSKLEFIENSRDGAVNIRLSLYSLKPDDIVIVLLSSGESSLLTLPKFRIRPQEIMDLITKLKKRGANDNEIKCIRRQFSELEGGGLAKACYPAKVITLMLSDVKNDAIELIANGAMCFNRDDPQTTNVLLMKYNLYDDLPISLKEVLIENAREYARQILENRIPIEGRRFLHVDNYLIGNNETAVHGAFREAERQGFQTLIVSTSIAGVVEEIAKFYVFVAKLFSDYVNGKIDRTRLCQVLWNSEWEYLFDKYYLIGKINDMSRNRRIQKFCLIASGMPTAVNAENGGRNRHLAFWFSKGVQNVLNSVFFLSCSTSGLDEGTTDAAGAVGHSALILESFFTEKSDILNSVTYENSQNFYNLFRDGKYLIKTGPTGTNVGDIHIIIICPNEYNFGSTYCGSKNN